MNRDIWSSSGPIPRSSRATYRPFPRPMSRELLSVSKHGEFLALKMKRRVPFPCEEGPVLSHVKIECAGAVPSILLKSKAQYLLLRLAYIPAHLISHFPACSSQEGLGGGQLWAP